MKRAMQGWMLSAGVCLATLPMSAGAGTDFIFVSGFDPFPGFQVQLPDITVAPGESTTYSYFFRAAVADTLAVNRWASVMTPGTHHLIAYATYGSNWTPLEVHPPGTLLQAPCGLDAGGIGSVGWLYAAHHLTQELVLPDDDGAGQPLAMEIQSGQPLCVEIYAINATGTPLVTTTTLRAEGLSAGEGYTRSATYFSYNTNISIPPASTVVVHKTCPTPTGAKFWSVSTRTHKFATLSRVLDGTSPLVANTNWEDPQATLFPPPAFHTFATGGLTYECTYVNTGNATISAGDSEDTDEVCMGVGYFFPALHPAFCINNIGPL